MAFLRQGARVVERFRIIEVTERESVTEAARRFDCSRTTIYKLIARYREGGLRALMNRRRGAPAELRKLLPVEISRLARRDATISLQRQRYAVPPELMSKDVWVGLLGDDIVIEHASRTVIACTR